MRNKQSKKALGISARYLAAFFLLCGLCLNAAAQDVAVFPQIGHTAWVYSVAFSHDGKQALSGSMDGTVKLWDIASGREQKTFSGHTSSVQSVSFSSDGKQALSGSSDFTVKLWDISTGREIRTFSGHSDFVTSVAFSPDGKQILSTGLRDNTIKLWDATTGRTIRTFSGHTLAVQSAVFNHEGNQILSSSWDETIKLWDVASGRVIRTFSGHTDRVYSVAFSPDGKQVLSGSSDKTIKLWDIANGRVIRTFSGHSSSVESVAFSPDGKQILSGSGKTVKLWDVASGREIRTFSGHSDFVTSVAFSPDGTQALSGSWDKMVKLWDIASGQEIRTFSGYSSSVRSVAYSPDGKQTIYGSNGIKLWDVVNGREMRTFSGHTYSVAFSPDGKQILSGGFHGGKQWDAASGRELKTFDGSESVKFSPDGKQILSNSENTVKLWDVASGREIKTFSGHRKEVSSVAFSPDGKQAVSGSYDDTVKLWDVASGRETRTFSGHTDSVSSVVFSLDGKQVLSGSWDGTVKLWDTANGRVIRTFSGHTLAVQSVAFSLDGKQVLSGSEDKTLKLWDTATGREIKTFSGHTNGVRSVTFSPDGRQVLSGSSDGTVRLWDVTAGKEIAQFVSFDDGEWICLTPDGFYNASPNGDKYLNVRIGNSVFGIDQYAATFYKPQIVQARLQGLPDPVRVTTTIQEAASPPVVIIRSPENGAGLSSSQVELSVSVVDQKQPIKNIKVLVNGRLVGSDEMKNISGSRRLTLVNTGIAITGSENRVDFRFPVTLNAGTNRIEVLASNPYSEGRDNIEVNYRRTDARQDILPNLWILSIGVNKYDANPQLPNLSYAVNDAKAIVDVFKAQEGKLYRKVNSLLIADGAAVTPNKDNIIDNFSFLKQAAQRDVVLLFIAGHGVNDDGGNFYFMPSDAAFNADGSIRPSRAISYREIQAVLDMPGQKLVFIDACHSEGTSGRKTRGADNNQLVRSLQDNSTVIFTSSRGNQLSQESPEFGHGIFTYAIIQGMKGGADLFKNGQVSMKELDTYVSEMVPKLTNGLQHPTTTTPEGYVNFIVAELK